MKNIGLDNRPPSRTGPRKVGTANAPADASTPDEPPFEHSGDGVRTAYSKARAQMESFRSYDQLSMVKHLKELWEERGLSSDDPAFLLMEALAMFDARQRAVLKNWMDSVEESDRFMLATNEEVATRLGEMRQLYEDYAKVGGDTAMYARDQRRLIEVVNNLLAFGKEMIKAISEMIGIIGNRSFWGVLMNWAVPAMGVVVGLILGKFIL